MKMLTVGVGPAVIMVVLPDAEVGVVKPVADVDAADAELTLRLLRSSCAFTAADASATAANAEAVRRAMLSDVQNCPDARKDEDSDLVEDFRVTQISAAEDPWLEGAVTLYFGKELELKEQRVLSM
jgi:hypothetical protein